MTLPLDPTNPLFTEPRYGTVDAIKKAMGINDTVWDGEITTALVTAELLIDQEVGGSFKTGEIPLQVTQAANLTGADIFKLNDSQFPGGSDDAGFIGVIDPSNAARSAFSQHRSMLFGLRTSRGFA